MGVKKKQYSVCIYKLCNVAAHSVHDECLITAFSFPRRLCVETAIAKCDVEATGAARSCYSAVC